MSKSDLEALLALQLKAFEIPAWESEFRFAPPRRFRFDFAWPKHKLAVEVQGGTWVNGGHNRGVQYRADCVKSNLAVENGWRVLRYTNHDVEDGSAVQQIERVLAGPMR